MEYFVQYGTDITAGAKESTKLFAVPIGFPFLMFKSDSGVGIVKPASLYLCSRFLVLRLIKRSGRIPIKRTYSKNTALAYATDLKDWWEYLQVAGLQWDQVEHADLRSYRDIMLQTVSPATHRPYSRSTVRRRISTLLSFYEWASHQGLYQDRTGVLNRRELNWSRPLDTIAMAHVGVSRSKKSDLIPAPQRGIDDAVRAMLPTEYRLIAEQLGPLPSEAPSLERSRDRLATELSLHSGMRIDEVTNLTQWQILDLVPKPESPHSIHYMTITKTKGLRARRIEVPNWLLNEVLIYIEGERRHAVEAGKRAGGTRDPGTLFVNSSFARHNAGKPYRADSLDDAFRKAVKRAGLVRTEERINPESGIPYLTQAPRFSFHDLRHTFAIFRYYAERRAGNAEPWKIIQALLGHQALHTTTELYLRPTAEFEAHISDAVAAFYDQD